MFLSYYKSVSESVLCFGLELNVKNDRNDEKELQKQTKIRLVISQVYRNRRNPYFSAHDFKLEVSYESI